VALRLFGRIRSEPTISPTFSPGDLKYVLVRRSHCSGQNITPGFDLIARAIGMAEHGFGARGAAAMQHPDQVESAPGAWYAVQCKWLKEDYAKSALELLLGLTVYLPLVQSRQHGQVRRAPFFPGYLFAHANLSEVAPSRIQSMPGVVRMVAFEDRPQPIAEPVIDYIRQQVRDLNTCGGLPVHNFKPGDLVRFKSGPFQGLEAVFQGPTKPSERVRVLLEFLGRPREMSIDAAKLEQTSAASPHPPRRTRGHGRRIRYE
jgi:transcriptional antiterminator RfaH